MKLSASFDILVFSISRTGDKQSWWKQRSTYPPCTGCLQRFAVCYCVVGLVEVLFIKRKNSNLPRAAEQPQITEAMGQPVESTFIPYLTRDLPQLKWHWLIMLTFLFIHSCVVFLMPVPDGCPTGYLGPGGLHEGGKYFNCTGGATVRFIYNQI